MNLSDACKQVSKGLNIDYNEVYKIAKFQFDFIVDVMKDKDDYHDILINNTFRFKLKNRFKHENNDCNHGQCSDVQP